MLFGGLYINVGNIPPWFVWIYYISMFHYGYEALIINEFQGVTFECPSPPQPCFFPTGDSVIKNLSMTTPISNIWINVGILFALMIGLKILSYLCLRFIQKPKGG
jgi:ABC-type multidrug transport system permease subunit